MHSEPISFIHLERQNDLASRFVINPQAVERISAITTPIVVITIAGLYRTGKSFVMNQLADAQSGFDLGYSVEPKTQGLWMWILDSDAVRKKFNLPSDATVLLMDTEGLGSYTKTQAYDAKVFALAILLSSYLIYNSMGTIDDTAVENISLLVEVTKSLKTSAPSSSATSKTSSQPDDFDLHLFFPKFMWLLRDFSLELIQDGKTVTPSEYLENSLAPLSGSGPEIETKNRTRECLKRNFPDRTCFTLKRPVVDEELLQDLEKISMDQFRPEYLKSANILCDFIYQHATPKSLFGYRINGQMFVQLAQSYIDALNGGGMPVIQNTWEQVTQVQCRQAVDRAVEKYKSLMSAISTKSEYLEESEFSVAHDAARKESYALFHKSAVGSESSRYLDELDKEILMAFKTLEVDNSVKGRSHCEGILSSLLEGLSLQVKERQIDSFDALMTEWRTLLKRYDEKARGAFKSSTFYRLAPDVLMQWTQTVSQHQIASMHSKFEIEIGDLKRKHEKDYVTLQELYKSVDSERLKQEDYTKTLRTENKDLKFEVGDLAKTKRNIDGQIAELQDEVKSLKEFITTLEQKNMGLQTDVKQTEVALTKEMTEKKALEVKHDETTKKAHEDIQELKTQNTQLFGTKTTLEEEVEKNKPGYPAQCHDQFTEIFGFLRSKLSDYNSIPLMVSDIQKSKCLYEQRCEGWQRYAVFVERSHEIWDTVSELHDLILKREVSTYTKELKTVQNEAEVSREDWEKTRKELDCRTVELEAGLSGTTQTLALLQVTLDSEREEWQRRTVELSQKLESTGTQSQDLDSKLTEKNAKIQELEMKIIDSQQKSQALRQEMSDKTVLFTKDLDSSSQRQETLKSDIELLQLKLRDIESIFDSKEIQLKQQQDDKTVFEEKYQELLKKVEEANLKSKTIKTELDQSQALVITLQERIPKEKTQTDGCQDPEILDKYLKEISSEVSENKIKSFAGLRKGWVRLLNRYEKESEGEAKYRGLYPHSIDLLDFAESIANAQMMKAEEQNDALGHLNKRLQVDHKALTRKYETMEADFQREMEVGQEKRDDFEKLRVTHAETSGFYTAMKIHVDEMKKTALSVDEELNLLRNKNQKAAAFHAKIVEAEKAKEDAETKLKAMTEMNDKARQAHVAFEAQVEKARSNKKDLDQQLKEREVMLEQEQARFKEMEVQIQKLETEREELEENHQADVTKFEDMIQDLEQASSQVKAELEQAMDANEGLAKEVNLLRDKDVGAATMHAKTVELESLKEELEAKLDEVNEALAANESERNELERELEITRTELEEAQQTLESTQKTVESLKEERVGANEVLLSLEAKENILQKQITDLRNQISTLSIEKNDLEKRLNEVFCTKCTIM